MAGLCWVICNGFRPRENTGLSATPPPRGALIRNRSSSSSAATSPGRSVHNSPFNNCRCSRAGASSDDRARRRLLVATSATLDEHEAEDRVAAFRYIETERIHARHAGDSIAAQVMGHRPHPERRTEPLMGSTEAC